MSEPVRVRPDVAAPERPQLQPLSDSAPPPMGWHKFRIYGMLWLEAALHLMQAWSLAGGRIYNAAQIRDAVYAGLPGMRALDYGLAALLVCGAALQILARFRLAGCSTAGPRLLTAAYAALLGGNLTYALARLLYAGLSPLSLPLLGRSAVYLALLLIDRSYYRRRGFYFETLKGVSS